MNPIMSSDGASNSKCMPFRARTVGKSKFANYNGTEISDENSREHRRITEEEPRLQGFKQEQEMLVSPKRIETMKLFPIVKKRSSRNVR